MKNLGLALGLIVALVLMPTAHAGGPWKVGFQNIKLPSQQLLQAPSWTNPAAPSATLLVSSGTAATSAATTFSSMAAQPDFARNIVITPGGTTANVGAGSAVVTGTNIYGKAITESIAISGAQSSASTGLKAFKTVSSVLFPATTGAGVTVSIGTGSALGRSDCAKDAGQYAWSSYGGVYETTRGTFAADPAVVELNTFQPNGTLDGAHNVQLFYVQNYACYGR